MSFQHSMSQNQIAISEKSRALAQAIDHTKLTFAADEEEQPAIEKLCQEAAAFGFYAVCVRPRHVALCKGFLQQSDVKVATVIGFPTQRVLLADALKHPTIGDFSWEQKEEEALHGIQAGADELDWVISVAAFKKDVQSGGQQVLEELHAIRDISADCLVKVIIETDLLTNAEIEQVTQWCAETGMGMVKTSTGMVDGGQGVTLADVRLIAQTLKKSNRATGIKASGGIKNRAQALAFLEAGVNRLGTSSGIAIVTDGHSESSGY